MADDEIKRIVIELRKSRNITDDLCILMILPCIGKHLIRRLNGSQRIARGIMIGSDAFTAPKVKDGESLQFSYLRPHNSFEHTLSCREIGYLVHIAISNISNLPMRGIPIISFELLFRKKKAEAQ